MYVCYILINDIHTYVIDANTAFPQIGFKFPTLNLSRWPCKNQDTNFCPYHLLCWQIFFKFLYRHILWKICRPNNVVRQHAKEMTKFQAYPLVPIPVAAYPYLWS